MNNQFIIGKSDIDEKDRIYFLILPIFISVTILFRSMNNDIWFLLAHGRYVLNFGIPKIEPFTIHEGLNFVMQQWLSAVIFYSTYSNFGELGVKLLIVLTYLFSIFIFYKLCIKLAYNNFFKAMIVTYIYSALVSGFMTSRPFIFTNILLLLEVYLLESYFMDQKAKRLFVMPILSFILINIQASNWLMLFVVMVPFIIDSFTFKIGPFYSDGIYKMPIALSLISMIIAGFFNPYGVNAMTYIRNSFGVQLINDLVVEMKPATVTTLIGIVILISSIIINYIYIFGESTRRSVRYILFALGTSYLSLLNIRGYFFFAICAIYPLSVFGENVRIPKFEKQHPKRTVIIRKILIGLLILLTPIAFYRISFDNNKYNDEIKEFYSLLQIVIEDKKNNDVILYTGYNDGGLAEYYEVATYIDPRAEVFLKKNNMKEDIFLEYNNLQFGKIYYKVFLEKYNFTHIIVDDNDLLYKYLEFDKNYKIVLSKNKYRLYKSIK